MSDAYDPIPELRRFGYTEREAAFLYLVGIHSGHFLRRQYLAFIQKEDGAMVQRLLAKSVGLEHVCPIEYEHGRHIYHLKSKRIYRILGQEDSQNRRSKGDRQIQARLMLLDYVLGHFGEQFLETEQQKVKFFHEKLGIPLESLPQVTQGNRSHPRYFPDHFSVTVEQPDSNSAPLVTLVFLDDGLRSISSFVRWLEQHTPLLNALHRADVIYTATGSRNFPEAEREFLRRFPKQNTTEDLPLGLDHFLRYLEVRRCYDLKLRFLTPSGMRIMEEGDPIYPSLEHRALLATWKMGNTNEARVRSHYEQRTRKISILGHLLESDYPIWSRKYRRTVL